jgi:hypothetical protein
MLLGLKSLMKRPFSQRELEEASTSLIKRPPIMNEWRDKIEALRVSSGRSFLDFWRSAYIENLQEISQKSTWEAQRASLISIAMEHQHIRSIYAAQQNIRHVDSWASTVEHNPMFSAAPRENWADVMLQYWLFSIMSSACLLTIGQKLYSINEGKENEMEIYNQWNKETYELRFQAMDMLFDALQEQRDSDAAYLTKFIDEELNTYLKERDGLAMQMRESIANRSLDLKKMEKQFSDASRRREVLAQRVLQG